MYPTVRNRIGVWGFKEKSVSYDEEGDLYY